MSDIEVRSLDETARFFDVSVPTVRSWIADGCPVEKKGGNGVAYELDLVAVHAWRTARKDEEVRAAAERAERDNQLRMELLGDQSLSATDTVALSAKARADTLRAEIDHTKLAQLRRELVNAAELSLAVTRAMGALRDQLRSLPDTLARKTGLTDDQVQIVSDCIDEALSDCATTIEEAMATDAAQAA